MFIGLGLKTTYLDPRGLGYIHVYIINDDAIIKDNLLNIKAYKKNGEWNDIEHMNDLLYGIYDFYKKSKSCVKRNFEEVMKLTFSKENSWSILINTEFYKSHKQIFERLQNV